VLKAPWKCQRGSRPVVLNRQPNAEMTSGIHVLDATKGLLPNIYLC